MEPRNELSGVQARNNGARQPGNQEQTRLHGRVPRNQLQMLRDEEQEPNIYEHGEQVRQNPPGEHGVFEEPNIEHGGGSRTPAAQLTTHEEEPEYGANKRGAECERIHARFGNMGETEGYADHGDHNQQDTHHIERAGVWVFRFGHGHGCEGKERYEYGYRHEEHRPPPEMAQQESAHDGAECCTGGEACRPHGDCGAAFFRVTEDVANE